MKLSHRVGWGIAAAVTVIAAIVFATLRPATQEEDTVAPADLRFTEIAARIMVDGRLQGTQYYTTSDSIGLNVQTTADPKESYTVMARLITKAGKLIPLTPDTLTLRGPQDSFCCWTVGEPGEYSLQIIKPDTTITSVPLTVQQGSSTQTTRFSF